jgi:type II secretory pathway component PulF
MRDWLMNFKLQQGRRTLRSGRGQLYYELSVSLREHVPLVNTLRKYEMRARMRGSSLSLAYLEMLRGLQTGSVSAALSHIATPLERTLMDASQSAGDQVMADGFLYMAQTVEKVEKMRAALHKAFAYPIFLLVLFSVMLTGFSLLAVPVLVELLPPSKWPPLGQVLYWISSFVSGFGLYVVCVLAVLVLFFVFSLERWVGDLRLRVDNYFPYNLYRDFAGSMMLVSLAAMMRSGISLRTSLDRAQGFAAPWMKWHIRKIMRNLARPSTPYFGQAFNTGVLNMDMSDKVQDASERRDPVEAFIRAGSSAIDQMMALIEKRAVLLNTVMMLVCGIVLGLMFAGFMSTAMTMQSGLNVNG